MKFFTKAWCDGDMPDAEAERVPALYVEYLFALGAQVPSDARRLAIDVNLHDGLLRVLKLDSKRLEMVLRAGDLQVGYFDATLLYEGATVSRSDEQFLREAVGNREIELAYDEFDHAESKWVHRLLFQPYREASIYFESFTLRTMPVRNRIDGP